MHAKSIDLVWIVVKDFKRAIKFYTETVGLKIVEMNEQWGWAELEGQDGCGMRLGIAQQNLKNQDPVQPGENAVITVRVDNIEQAVKNLQKQGTTLVGAVEEVPGHVKLQTVRDTEGNFFQLVELITEKSGSKHHDHKASCCH
jgi:predicted enzyme related to lactoylglutathione lyase